MQVLDTNEIRRSLAQGGLATADLARHIERLTDEVDRLRRVIDEPVGNCSHQCIECHHRYAPAGANEDCPRCGCDGTR